MKNTTIHNKSKDLSLLLDISLQMIEKTDLDSLLRLIMEEATKTMNADRSTLYLIDRERTELVSFFAQTSEIREIRLPLGTGIAGFVACHGTTINIDDAYSNPLFNRETDTITGYRTKSVLCVPMNIHNNEIIGVLQVLNKKNGVFSEYDEWLFKTYANYAATAIENARLHGEHEKMFLSAIKALAAAIDRRDPITSGHSERVANLSVEIGKAIGLSKNELKILKYTAVLHDIEKIGIRDAILLKPDRFTLEEKLEMNKHAQYTEEILKEIYFTGEFRNIPEIAAAHHERPDGTGYPGNLKLDQLDIKSRIIAVADIFDALTACDRPYKKSFSQEEALDILRAEAEQNHLDSSLVNILTERLKSPE
ncbi:MAG: GAF domain-containing protein [wastewater metagenome]|nr:GAF domain-containing protein [Candidatus Loosdrechtia aerotolerans]